jgi:hypothetical protein
VFHLLDEYFLVFQSLLQDWILLLLPL